MKRSKRGLSKKTLPKDAVRYMNDRGIRVWYFRGKEFLTLRTLLLYIKLNKLEAK